MDDGNQLRRRKKRKPSLNLTTTTTTIPFMMGEFSHTSQAPAR